MVAFRSPRGDSVGGKGESVGWVGRLGVAFVRPLRWRSGRRCLHSRRRLRPLHPPRPPRRDDAADAPPPAPSADTTSTQSAPADPAPHARPEGARRTAGRRHQARGHRARRAREHPADGTPRAARPRAARRPRARPPEASRRRRPRMRSSSSRPPRLRHPPLLLRPPGASARRGRTVGAAGPRRHAASRPSRLTAAEPSEAANAEAASEATALIVTFRPRAGDLLAPRGRAQPRQSRPSGRFARRGDRQAARPKDVRPTHRPRAALAALRRGSRLRRPARHLHLLAQPGGAGRDRPGAARETVRRVEARPPPESKAAKKHPVAEVRPTIPFGSSGQGVANDGFSGSPGSTSSSRLFALAAAPLRVPLPFRFARVRVPSTRPHGVIAAPPTARPG